jgi:hypothetical protein
MADAPQTPIRTVEQQGLPSARVEETAPAAAFGGGESLKQVTDAGEKLATSAQDLASQEVQKTNEVAVNSSLARLKQKSTEIQLAAQNMKGQDALQAQDFVGKQWQKAIDDEQGGLSNGAQQRSLGMHAADLGASLNEATQRHMFQQKQQWDNDTTTALINSSKTHAIVNASNPQIVQQDLDTQRAAVSDWARRMGVPPDSEVYKQHLTEILSETHTGVIQAQLDAGNTKGAESYFAQNIDTMAGADVLKISKAIEQNKDVSLGFDLYNQVKGFKLADGRTPDEGRMESDIMSRDMPDEKKLRMIQFIKGRAREDIMNMHLADQARDEAFKNQAIKAKQAGMTLADQLKSIPKYSFDASDQAAKEAALEKMYAPPAESDVHVKVALATGIDDGTTTKQDLDQALQKGTINDKDYFTLSSEFHRANVEGRTPQMRIVNAQIKENARTQFGADPDKIANFIDTVNAAGMGKTPQQKLVLAQEELKRAGQTVPGSGHWYLLGFGGKNQLEADQEKVQNTELAIGNLQNDIGPDNARALAAGAAIQKRPFDEKAVLDMSRQFGGYDKMLPGQPVFNAIQFLRSINKPVVPENIQWAFDKGYVKAPPKAAAAPAAPTPAAPPSPASAAPTKKGKTVGERIADAKDFVLGDIGSDLADAKKALIGEDETAGGATDFASRYNK